MEATETDTILTAGFAETAEGEERKGKDVFSVQCSDRKRQGTDICQLWRP